ncbi:TatD family hydrolase [Candidatus Nomurabacteria bacterium]|nr:TatD family hydrolase [Candidatus Nomurabacteria bacterium]
MTPKYIDIHSHVNFTAFDADRDAVIRHALDNDTWVINVGTQVDTSRSAVELAHKYPEGVYAVIGLHPIHTSVSYHDKQELGDEGSEFTSRGEVFDKNIYRELLKDPKTVAIGECGLDYYHSGPELIEKQKEAFVAQIELANEIGKPLMLHIRDAYADALVILKEHSKVKGVVHFFTGTLSEAQGFLDFGFMISFAGAITFPPKKDGTGAHSLEVIKNIPLDMILTDTDSPYVAPVPYRGKRNEPVYVREIVKKIAEVKNLPEEEVAQAIVANAKRMFGI